MNARHTSAPVIDPDDIGYNNTSNPALESLTPARLSRRGMLRMGFGTAGSALLGSAALAGCGGGGDGGGSGSTATPGGIDTIDLRCPRSASMPSPRAWPTWWWCPPHRPRRAPGPTPAIRASTAGSIPSRR